MGSLFAQPFAPFSTISLMQNALAGTPVSTPNQPGEPDGFLVSVRREGGMCLPPGCITELTIFADGTYQYVDPPVANITGRISTADLRVLKRRIATTDFEALRQAQPANPIPNLCLLPVDGPEAVYTFWTGTGNGLPVDNRFEQVQGCETPIDANNALFQQLERLYSQISNQVTDGLPATHEVPEAVAQALQAALQRDYQNRLTDVRVTASTVATWQDCDSGLSQGGISAQPCDPKTYSGWRAVVTGEFPSLNQSITRAYYTNEAGSVIVPDHVGSLSAEVRSQIAQQVNLPTDQITLIAAQEEAFYPATACPQTGSCPIAPIGLSWRVLVQAQGINHLIDVSSLGSPLHTPESDAFFSEANRDQLGNLSPKLANAAVRDAQARLFSGEIAAPVNLPGGQPTGAEIDFQVESIRPVTWSGCNGGTGPTQPIMGTCSTATLGGWQMIVTGGLKQSPFRLVYYIPDIDYAQSPDPVVLSPDGMQSLPADVSTRILETAAQEIGVPTTELRLHWVESQWFDGCLNTAPQQVSCHNAIRPGWRIEILGAQSVPGSPWAMPLWIYHTNLTGTELHLLQRGQWAPPPSAPPQQS